jgi:hypothetical protein
MNSPTGQMTWEESSLNGAWHWWASPMPVQVRPVAPYAVRMAKPGPNIRIPLSEGEAVALLGRVRPTKGMPRPGANPTKAKAKPKADRRTKRERL